MKSFTVDTPTPAPDTGRTARQVVPDDRPETDRFLDLQATAGNAALASVLAPDANSSCPCKGGGGSCPCGHGTAVGMLQRAPDDGDQPEEEVIGNVAGEGPGGDYSSYANVNLHGRCDANYGGTTFSAQNVAVRRAPDGTCTASGTMTSTFVVGTNVTLPQPPSGLSECQRANAQRFIDQVLAPHEQDHVNAFETYNGSVSTPFSVTACNATQLQAALQPLHNAIDTPRQTAANGASAALDPFTRTFDMDEGCGQQSESTEGE